MRKAFMGPSVRDRRWFAFRSHHPARSTEKNIREEMMNASRNRQSAKYASALAAITCALLTGTTAAPAADTTYERLANPEPHNWLMHHHDYNAQRYSTLDAINRGNIRNMRLLFAVALGGVSKDDSLEATPLVEDGFMYMADSSGIVSKIDVRSGASGPVV
jgi:alcohol dehydrogenase (cytochrome c)